MPETRKMAVVLHEDRHCDPSVFLFEDPDEAVAFAKARIREFDRFNCLDETPVAGWLYNATIEDVGGIRVTLEDVKEADHA